MHVVLLGDSVFDNGAYVGGGPDVVAQLRERLPRGSKATLLAVDGSVASGVERQLARLPEGATHLVVSTGGNDALGHVDILQEGASTAAEVLERLGEVSRHFERNYRLMVGALRARRLPSALCTIYYPRFTNALMQRLAVAALTHFNDPIVRAAFTNGLPLVDLRLVCDSEDDYANPIEPSARGGAKIAAAVARLVAEHDFSRGRTEVFTS